jgi:hypothetical protein
MKALLKWKPQGKDHLADQNKGGLKKWKIIQQRLEYELEKSRTDGSKFV